MPGGDDKAVRWIELKINVSPELVEPVVQLFQQYGKTVPFVEEEAGYNPDEGEVRPINKTVTVRCYLKPTRASLARQARIEIGVRLLSMIHPISDLEIRDVDSKEWEKAWKLHARPFRVGRRLVICPFGQTYRPARNDIVIYLDSGLAFGTGHHPTTRMCLEELELLIDHDCSVLDVGCGSGILTVASGKLGSSKILAVDIDRHAVQSTKRNVRLNEVVSSVQVKRGSIPANDWGGVSVVVANISAKVIIDLAEVLAAQLSTNGSLIASGFLEGDTRKVITRLENAGLLPVKSRQIEDWVVVVVRKD